MFDFIFWERTPGGLVGKGIRMANLLKIKIKERKFIDVTCENGSIDKFKPSHIVANGWDCRIYGNGKIYCETKETYPDGEHFMKFVINNSSYGTYQFKLKRPNEETVTLEEGRVTKPTIQELCLSDGYIDDRLAYFV